MNRKGQKGAVSISLYLLRAGEAFSDGPVWHPQLCPWGTTGNPHFIPTVYMYMSDRM